jgi:hypothetical protein
MRLQYTVLAGNRKIGVQGTVMEKILVAEECQAKNEDGYYNSQYVATHRFMIHRDGTDALDIVHPNAIIAIVSPVKQES